MSDDVFHVRLHQNSLRCVAQLVDLLASMNMNILRHLKVRPLDEQRVALDCGPDEDFSDLLVVSKEGRGNACSLAAWRLAELRVQGVAARVRCVTKVRKSSESGCLYFNDLVEVVLAPEHGGRIEWAGVDFAVT